MERTKNKGQKQNEGKSHFKKIGGGTFRLGNNIIKPGQTFWAFPDEIPEGFRDVVIALEGNIVFEKEKKGKEKPLEDVKAKELVFTAKQREGSQWWDIFDSQNKKVNDKGLTKEKAEKFIEDLKKK